jgi:hypothetical protein
VPGRRLALPYATTSVLSPPSSRQSLSERGRPHAYTTGWLPFACGARRMSERSRMHPERTVSGANSAVLPHPSKGGTEHDDHERSTGVISKTTYRLGRCADGGSRFETALQDFGRGLRVRLTGIEIDGCGGHRCGCIGNPRRRKLFHSEPSSGKHGAHASREPDPV